MRSRVSSGRKVLTFVLLFVIITPFVTADGDGLSLMFFLNVDYDYFVTMYNTSTNLNLPKGTNRTTLQRAKNYMWMEFCRNLGDINGSGYVYSDGMPVFVQVNPADEPVPKEITTTPTTTTTQDTPYRRLHIPFGMYPHCSQVNRLATCLLSNVTDATVPGTNGITVDFSVGTLTKFVVVVNITFPAQPVMNSTRLRAELHKKNNLQDITFNFNWTLLDDAATYQNCAIGYYQNTVLWLIDDPDKGDHSDVILGAALSSLFIFGLAFGGTYFLVYRLRHTEKYIELHKYEFDQEDLLESYAEYAPTAADEEL